MHSFESLSFVIIALSRFISYHGRRKGKVGSLRAKREGHRTVVTKNMNEARTILGHTDLEDIMWSRVKVVEQILEEKLILLAGFDEEITKICSVDHIEEEIEVAVEIRLRIQQTKGEIAIARARVKNGGTSSSSHGSTQNHHTEEHTATNNPNQAPMPLQDNQHASSENSVQIHQG